MHCTGVLPLKNLSAVVRSLVEIPQSKQAKPDSEVKKKQSSNAQTASFGPKLDRW